MEEKISDLYLRDTYLNKNIDILTNQTIIEYDLKSANTSLSREYKLLPTDKIDKIADMPREDRVKTIGKLMRKDSEFKEGLKAAFVDIRKRFFEANHIQDGDILAIRKDAIFCLREVECNTFGFCKFSSKNRYTSFLRLDRLEFYYNSKGKVYGGKSKLDVKGINDDILIKHEEFMMEFFRTLFRHLEVSPKKTQINYLKRFIDKYKRRELEVGYYREFNQESIIRLTGREETYDEEVFIPFENKQPELNIDYNFFNILLPIVKILV